MAIPVLEERQPHSEGPTVMLSVAVLMVWMSAATRATLLEPSTVPATAVYSMQRARPRWLVESYWTYDLEARDANAGGHG